MSKKIECSVCDRDLTSIDLIYMMLPSWDGSVKIPVCSAKCQKKAEKFNAEIRKINDKMEKDWERRTLSKNT